MSVRHPKAVAWEHRLREAFREVDHLIEERHAERWPLRSSRPAHGTIDDFESSGLFEIGAAFSPGYGSAHGPGYVVQFSINTPSRVTDAERRAIKAEAIEALREALPRYFPGRTLTVSPEGVSYRIHGDLSLKDDADASADVARA
jgi:hypothetical protein